MKPWTATRRLVAYDLTEDGLYIVRRILDSGWLQIGRAPGDLALRTGALVMSVWKKIPIAPGGVMPGGLITKIGVAAISLLLAATLLTYTFTGGGGPEAEIDVPEAASFDLQQRAAAAIAAEARRQAEQLRQQATAAERQLAQLQNEQESTAALLGSGIVGLPGQDPGTGLVCRRSTRPLRRRRAPHRSRGRVAGNTASRGNGAPPAFPAHRTACAVLSQHRMLNKRWRHNSVEVAPLPAGAKPHSRPYLSPKLSHLPPAITAQESVSTAGEFLQLLTELNDRELAATAQPAPAAASGPAPSLALLGSPKRKRPSSTGRPIRTVGIGFMRDRFWRPFWSPSSVASFPVRSSPMCRSPSIPRTANGSSSRAARGLSAPSGPFPGPIKSDLAVAFHRILWPDGRTVSLEFNGLNKIGESALKDEVDRHYFSMFAAAGAVGILSGLTAIGSNPYAGGRQGFQAGASQGLGEGAVRILDRFLNRLPTITIRAGHRVRIWFTGDVLVPPAPPPTGGIQ